MEHHFDVDDCIKYGMEEAVILYNIRFWIMKNEANGKLFYNGKTWTYNSAKAFKDLFPYFTERKINRVLNKLVEEGAIIKGEFNENPWDRTSWYALGDGKKLEDGQDKSDESDKTKVTCRSVKIDKCTSDKIDRSYTDKKTQIENQIENKDLILSADADCVQPLDELKGNLRKAFQAITPWSNYPKEQTNLERLAKGILNLAGPQWREVGSAILSTYLKLVQGADKFWTGQSFTPSGLLPHLDRIFHLARKEMTRGQEIQRLYNEITDAEKDGYRL